MSCVVVLLSGSENDIEHLIDARITIAPTIFIDCESGNRNTQVIQSERLLCFIRHERRRENNTNNLLGVLRRLQNQFDEIIVGTHTYPDPPSVACNDTQVKNEFPQIEIVGYSTGLTEEFGFVTQFCQELAQPCPNIQKIKDSFDKLFDELKGGLPTLIRRLSVLKHRIMYLWLPLDIDLRGIKEVRDSSQGDGVGYLEKVLEEKRDEEMYNGQNAYYRKKLARSLYMVVKVTWEAMEISCENDKGEFVPVPPDDDAASLLTDGKAILDLIVKSGKGREIKEEWEKLLKLCGVSYEGDPYKGEEIKVIPDSPIFQFMCYMDNLIQNWLSISGDDRERAIHNVLNWEGLDKQLSKLGIPVSGLPFHDWFCALDDMLGKLREKMAKQES